jgi:hypothetical protein
VNLRDVQRIVESVDLFGVDVGAATDPSLLDAGVVAVVWIPYGVGGTFWVTADGTCPVFGYRTVPRNGKKPTHARWVKEKDGPLLVDKLREVRADLLKRYQHLGTMLGLNRSDDGNGRRET